MPFLFSFLVLQLFLLIFFILVLFQAKICPKSDENGEWDVLHSEELHSLYHAFNMAIVVKSRWLIWTGHAPRIEECGMHSQFLLVTYWKETSKKT